MSRWRIFTLNAPRISFYAQVCAYLVVARPKRRSTCCNGRRRHGTHAVKAICSSTSDYVPMEMPSEMPSRLESSVLPKSAAITAFTTYAAAAKMPSAINTPITTRPRNEICTRRRNIIGARAKMTSGGADMGPGPGGRGPRRGRRPQHYGATHHYHHHQQQQQQQEQQQQPPQHVN
ncbi:hypothetical protein B0T26DRAFT_680848 [Lasiosphaeria miniovina]|uniref:Uncharacterized protein n=1 Tax=Lasiosphaeria miniovina TaxID=1954250 RepID=A0AA39ZT26_9PEZI|nr:uncharacterized protein B0T26DRAFT_680848 [Lasiosphaeria miniovina]KAK0703106.1 hypothetical protein B0T26DRAFT_680848 [Lasiosphaeria miniovina]